MNKTLKIRNLRWWIAGLLAIATALNYLDRQSLPVIINEIRKSIDVSEIDYSYLQMAFLFAYSLMYAIGGKIIDKLGTRIGYSVMIIWWSLSNMLHGFVSSVMGLGISRFLLGLGEGGGFPGSAKAVSEWFPAKERSFAFGIFNTGSSLGALIAPPMIAVITLSAGWRWVFIISGLAGLVWALIWLFVYRKPEKSRAITSKELDYLSAENVINNCAAETARPASVGWGGALRIKEVWGLLIMKFLSDSAWYFYIFWLPKYLGDVRGLNIKELGYFAWIPYAFAGFGSFAGGYLSSLLIKKGISLDRSRKTALGIAALMMPVSLFITSAPLGYAIIFFSIAMMGHQFWSTIVQTLPTDFFPASSVGTVAGLMGATGSFGAMIFSLFAGIMISGIGYGPVFIATGLLHPLSFIMALVFLKRIKQLDLSAYGLVRAGNI